LPVTASTWLTLGAEYRAKVESLSDPSFGIRGIDKYTATGERFLVDVDFRTQAGPRLFVQLSAATDSGRTPAERSFDKSDADLAQAFIDLPFPFDAAKFLVRLGRQELDFGGNRLVAVRDAANLRRAFDLALMSVDFEHLSATFIAGHPVLNRGGSFDDIATPGEKFWGARFAASLADNSGAPTGEIFFLGRSRERAVYQDAVGAELRRTYGMRFSGREARCDYAAQGSIQRGEVAGKAIRAYGIAADIGYSMLSSWRARLGVSFGIAGGDRTNGDGEVGTFDVLYPNLGYFTDAPLAYPGNNWDVQPNITLSPVNRLTVQGGVDALWRISRNDAVYEPPGLPLIRGTGSGGYFVTALSFVKATWHSAEHLALSASYVHASTGSLVRDRGGGDTDYGSVQLSLKL